MQKIIQQIAGKFGESGKPVVGSEAFSGNGLKLSRLAVREELLKLAAACSQLPVLVNGNAARF